MVNAQAGMTWGDPSAPKRVLLLHGLMGSSKLWNHLAQDFVSQGYFVRAPDLLGHGNARCSESYTIAAFADELQPFISTTRGRGGTGKEEDHPAYDIVIGHSLGAIVAIALLPQLASSTRSSANSVRVVLVDPPLEADREAVAMYRRLFVERVRNPPTVEKFMAEHPTWTREFAEIAQTNARLCAVEAVEGVIDQNEPWSYSHYLSETRVPENVSVIVLAADPTKGASVREEELKAYPHIAVKTVWGASHDIPFDEPGSVTRWL